MMNPKLPMFTAMAVLALAACGGADPARPADPVPSSQAAPRLEAGVVELYASAGTVQCTSGGTTLEELEELEEKLAAGGVQPIALACGNDGNVRAQVCGQPDGRIFMIDVAPEQAATARSLGLLPRADLPDAVRQPC
jgi:ABC-type glycerol-3-phosphate transport system substrate-binding protein